MNNRDERMCSEDVNGMTDTHVPLDETELEKIVWSHIRKSALSGPTQRGLIKKLNDLIAQELAHLKHTIREEIEERKHYCHKDNHQRGCVACVESSKYNSVLDDALSVPSLKESEDL